MSSEAYTRAILTLLTAAPPSLDMAASGDSIDHHDSSDNDDLWKGFFKPHKTRTTSPRTNINIHENGAAADAANLTTISTDTASLDENAILDGVTQTSSSRSFQKAHNPHVRHDFSAYKSFTANHGLFRPPLPVQTLTPGPNVYAVFFGDP